MWNEFRFCVYHLFSHQNITYNLPSAFWPDLGLKATVYSYGWIGLEFGLGLGQGLGLGFGFGLGLGRGPDRPCQPHL